MQQTKSRETGRAFADGRQFPRDTLFTFQARQKGFPPWARETLTYSERKVGSIFGKGFVDNPLSESPGEARVRLAKRQNALRAEVRERMDRGETDAQIADWLRTSPLGAIDIVAGAIIGVETNAIPADIRRRFGV